MLFIRLYKKKYNYYSALTDPAYQGFTVAGYTTLKTTLLKTFKSNILQHVNAENSTNLLSLLSAGWHTTWHYQTCTGLPLLTGSHHLPTYKSCPHKEHFSVFLPHLECSNCNHEIICTLKTPTNLMF